MNRTRITQQTTTTTVPLTGQLPAGRSAPAHEALRWDTFRGPLQWLLAGPGWAILRPAIDFVLLCAATVLALGGVTATTHVSPARAPLLALAPLVMVLFYLRGL